MFSRLLQSAALFSLQITSTATKRCRCFPGDACWPSNASWNSLNQTVGGRLIATTPLAAPCHFDAFAQYNGSACKSLQEAWFWPRIHYQSSSSVMAPYFANQSCDPFLPATVQCLVGTYVSYAVDVRDASDVSNAIAFAKKYNIRFVIRNTGHDYLGKSTGAGALAVWTHHLKDIGIVDYNSPHYNGRAIKMGAGVQGFEAYSAAGAHGLQVVGGECPTVGLAGGYTQGGGHSALSSKYGLAADQVLEWEVVDGTGQYMVASRTHNSDIYWALAGGGGGTYGVVLSMTSKAHQDIPVTGANLTFTSHGVSQDAFYEAVSTYYALLPAMVDAGAMSISTVTANSSSFSISPLTAPDIIADEVEQLLVPLVDKLQQLNINFTKLVKQFPGYMAEYSSMQAPLQVGVGQYGGRLIPRSVVEQSVDQVTAAHRYVADRGAQVVAVALNASGAVAGNVDNAVLPAWRETLMDITVVTPLSSEMTLADMVGWQSKMTEDFVPKLEALTPGSGTYMNEGDFRQPNFQTAFFGDNYERLLSIKNKYDPDHMFYATTAVGSEHWAPQEDGRLCVPG